MCELNFEDRGKFVCGWEFKGTSKCVLRWTSGGLKIVLGEGKRGFAFRACGRGVFGCELSLAHPRGSCKYIFRGKEEEAPSLNSADSVTEDKVPLNIEFSLCTYEVVSSSREGQYFGHLLKPSSK